MTGPLTNPKHELFAQHRAKGKTADESYQLAGFKPNRGNATRLNTNQSISARIDEILSKAAERVEITQARVLEELGRIGFSDIRKLFSPTGNLLPISELDDQTAACLSSVEVVTRKVPGGEEAEVEHVTKVKVWDKRAALVDLGKHLGLFRERIEHTGLGGAAIQIETRHTVDPRQLPPEQREALREIIAAAIDAQKTPLLEGDYTEVDDRHAD